MICSGYSSSPSNTASPQDGPRFPEITYYDNINAQYQLISEHFGIKNPLMYIGFSMGGQQAFHWGALHGDKTGGVVPLCGTAKTTTQNWITLEGCKLALQADAAYNGGDYVSPPATGLKAFALNYTSTLFDKEGYEENLHLKMFGGLADTEAYLEVLVNFFGGVDANDLLGMLNTWQNGDVGKHELFGGDTMAALANIKCPALVMPSATDLSFPARNNISEVAAMPNAELVVVPTKTGHFAGSLALALTTQEAVTFQDNEITKLLKRIG
jgi:Homoserine acetyltransferase